MCPDRVVSHVKRSFGTNNLYLPSQMIEKMNNVTSVTGEFQDHTDVNRPLFCGKFSYSGIMIDTQIVSKRIIEM